MPINSTTSDEIEKLFGRHKLPKLTEEEMENLSGCSLIK